MADSVPDYYQHLTEDTGEEEKSKQRSEEKSGSTQQRGNSREESSEPTIYRADAFRLPRPGDDWSEETVYTFSGPTIDGIRHNITVNIDDEVEADSVYDFAAQELALVEAQLDECRMLMDDPIELNCGRSAYRAIFCWYPEEDLKLYQEQIYVLHDGRGYTLTASFTSTTRKQLGAKVERMMLSFTPTRGLLDS